VLGRILGLILGGGLIELFLLIAAGSRFGAMPVFAVVIMTGLAGGMIVRHFGLKSLASLQAELRGTGSAEEAISKGVVGTIAGLLLILPGLIGDALGLLLLVPAIQSWLIRLLLSKSGGAGGFETRHNHHRRVIVIEGEAQEIDEGPPQGDKPGPHHTLR
jgi:UPF0716 protein FxsA